jgi:hypothetical protein
MTILIATIGENFAVVSQDTAVYGDDDASDADAEMFKASGDPAEAAHNTFVGDGAPPTARAAKHASKIVLLPNLHAVLFGSGTYAALIYWAWMLQTGGVGVKNIIGIDLVAPHFLPVIKERFSPAAPFLCCAVGWSESDGRVLGCAHNSVDHFKATLLTDGHVMNPLAHPDMPDYAQLYELSELAAHGERVEDFHVAVAKNQFATWRAGLLRPGLVIGGQLHTARVDRHGLSVRVTHTFPDPEAERQRHNPYWPAADYDGPAEPELIN